MLSYFQTDLWHKPVVRVLPFLPIGEMGKLELRLDEFMLETDDEDDDDDEVVFLVRPLATPGRFKYVIFLKPGLLGAGRTFVSCTEELPLNEDSEASKAILDLSEITSSDDPMLFKFLFVEILVFFPRLSLSIVNKLLFPEVDEGFAIGSLPTAFVFVS